jgi:hypothetical protein
MVCTTLNCGFWLRWHMWRLAARANVATFDSAVAVACCARFRIGSFVIVPWRQRLRLHYCALGAALRVLDRVPGVCNGSTQLWKREGGAVALDLSTRTMSLILLKCGRLIRSGSRRQRDTMNRPRMMRHPLVTLSERTEGREDHESNRVRDEAPRESPKIGVEILRRSPKVRLSRRRRETDSYADGNTPR